MHSYDRSLDQKQVIRPVILAGIFACVLFLGGFGLWSYLAPLQGAAIAQGSLVPEGSRRVVQHKEGGIVAAILVQNGDRVTAGAPLLTLADAGSIATKTALERRLIEIEATALRLRAEEAETPALEFPPELLARAKAASSMDALNAQASLFAARAESLAAKLSILDAQKEQMQATISGLEIQIASLKEQLALIAEEQAAQQELFDKGYATKPRLLALKRASAQLEGQIGQAGTQIQASQRAISEAEEQEAEIRKTRLDEIATGLAKAGSEIAELTQRLAAVDDMIARLTVTAPVSGIVMGLKVKTIGGVVPPGGEILEIVPDDERLVIEARIGVNDINEVGAGQQARIVFPALDQRAQPVIFGEVAEVSPDRIEDPATRTAWYLARVTVPESEIEKLGLASLRPGMATEVFISTGERSLVSWLLRPILESIDRAFVES